MRAWLSRYASLTLLAGMLLMFASCGKESLVEPCSKPSSAEAKSFTSSNDAGALHGASSSGNDDVDDGGMGIGDDGDDLSDSERSRKKRVN